MSANWRYLVSHALSRNLEMNLVTDLGRSESEIEMSRLVVHESMEVLLWHKPQGSFIELLWKPRESKPTICWVEI